ncbi:hypothetical protein R3W88_001227 [Solanum pinnatisectum]|uniref:C2H2-type domain-containing protein n=1 Tax=Solanum pinnatisectum TaxID=50273 RepID=A0AAV9MHM2_9SOLN|nr:hypothetical protein R3W88_001227 [Solanum pinnatisectum]
MLKITKESYKKPAIAWCYGCRIRGEVFTSSQGLARHQKKHLSHRTWMRGVPHQTSLCPSTDLATLYHELGEYQSTPLASNGQGNFYLPLPTKPMNHVVYRPRTLPGRPREVLYQPQQAMVLQVPRVVAHQKLFANRPNQLVENTNIIDQEALDLELKL